MLLALPLPAARSGDRGRDTVVGTGQDKRGDSKVLPVRVQRKGWGGKHRIHSGEEQGAGGGPGQPRTSEPPRGAGTAGERDENGNKTGYGEGIPTGAGPRGERRGLGKGGATP